MTAALLAIPEGAHQPKRDFVAVFSRDLAASLAGRSVSQAHANQIAAEIVTVLRSAGLATYKLRDASERFGTAMENLGVPAATAQRLARMLSALGDQVRGPSDLYLQVSTK